MIHESRCARKFKKHRECKACPSATVQDVDAKSAQILSKKHEEAVKTDHKNNPGHPLTNSNHSDRDATAGETQGRAPDIIEIRNVSDMEKEGHQRTDRHPPQEHNHDTDDSTDIVIVQGSSAHPKRVKSFIRIAKALFQLFLPLQYSSVMVARYWGSVSLLIEVNVVCFPGKLGLRAYYRVQDEGKFNRCFDSIESRAGFPGRHLTLKNHHQRFIASASTDALEVDSPKRTWRSLAVSCNVPCPKYSEATPESIQ